MTILTYLTVYITHCLVFGSPRTISKVGNPLSILLTELFPVIISSVFMVWQYFKFGNNS